jgi:hypothetical protein
MFYCSNE